jgi:hypothetical protein
MGKTGMSVVSKNGTNIGFKIPQPSSNPWDNLTYKMPYSVEATCNILCYQISKDDLIGKLSKELQNQLTRVANRKKEWIEQRF